MTKMDLHDDVREVIRELWPRMEWGDHERQAWYDTLHEYEPRVVIKAIGYTFGSPSRPGVSLLARVSEKCQKLRDEEHPPPPPRNTSVERAVGVIERAQEADDDAHADQAVADRILERAATEDIRAAAAEVCERYTGRDPARLSTDPADWTPGLRMMAAVRLAGPRTLRQTLEQLDG